MFEAVRMYPGYGMATLIYNNLNMKQLSIVSKVNKNRRILTKKCTCPNPSNALLLEK